MENTGRLEQGFHTGHGMDGWTLGQGQMEPDIHPVAPLQKLLESDAVKPVKRHHARYRRDSAPFGEIKNGAVNIVRQSEIIGTHNHGKHSVRMATRTGPG